MAQKDLKRAVEAERQNNRIRATAAHLEITRRVFHRDNLPRRVIESRLQRLCIDINDLLQRFAAPFRCSGVDAKHFRVRFHDGHAHTAERLSGGQKVLFALAFRVAVNALFAGDLNLLCLDEPTAGLDRENQR